MVTAVTHEGEVTAVTQASVIIIVTENCNTGK